MINRLAAAACAALLAVAAGGCGVETLSYRPPPPTAAPAASPVPTTTLPDTSGVILPKVAGVTTTTAPAATGGSATLEGTVTGPKGQVVGATVQATRVVDGVDAPVTAVTKAGGAFSLTGLQGGDYRVRAWQAPTLAMTSAQVFFLDGNQVDRLTLQVSSYSGTDAVGVFNPDPPTVDQPSALAVQVTQPTVGSDGVVSQRPLAGAKVELTNGPGWVVVGTNPVPTAYDGEATFTVACIAPGQQPLEASVNGQAPVSLHPPSCSPAVGSGGGSVSSTTPASSPSSSTPPAT